LDFKNPVGQSALEQSQRKGAIFGSLSIVGVKEIRQNNKE